MRVFVCGIVWLISTTAALAGTCPVAPDHGAAQATVIAQIRAAKSETEARALSSQLWAFWTDAPDAQAQALLDRGMTRRSGYDFLGALQDLNALVAYCPDYAEGYNQRAFVNYLRQDFSAALVDLDRTLAISPDHIGALSGRALSLMALKRTDDARDTLNRALALNPWLSERALIAPGGPLAPPGQDI